MSSTSPSVILYSSAGVESTVVSGTVIPAGTGGYLSIGSNGTDGYVIATDNFGDQIVVGLGVAGTPAGGVLSIQGVTGGTPVTITGTVTATNPSVGTDGAAALGFDTQVGGITTTNAPTYTTGNLDALSLTTKGGLRVDGVFPTGAAVPISDAMYVAGAVTTAAPTYTTGQMDPLSIDTAGNLRVLANQPTAANLNATVVGTTAAGSGASTGLVTIQGNASGTPVPVTGFVTTNKATTSTVTSVTVTANANNALLASNANRVAATIYNNTNKNLNIKYGTTASTSSFSFVLLPASMVEVQNDWTGEVDAFAPNAATGSILVTELTP